MVTGPKIKNPHIGYLLERLASITEHWPAAAIVNEAARVTFRHTLPITLRLYLEAISGISPIDVEIRNSANVKGRFNLWLSDVDTALIFDSLPSKRRLGPCLAAYRRASRAFPWLGETEIYSRGEWKLRNQLREEFKSILDSIWLLRKWSWQMEARRQARSHYHRTKCDRSIAAIRAALGISASTDLGAAITQNLASAGVVSGPSAQETWAPNGFRGFLEWSLEPPTQVSTELRAIPLPIGDAISLASLLPDGERYLPGLTPEVLLARRQPERARAFDAICANETLLALSHGRVYGETRELIGWRGLLTERMGAAMLERVSEATS